MYRKILIAYDGSIESRSALDECIRLAPGPEARIHLLAVINLGPLLTTGEFVAEASVGSEERRMQEDLAEGRVLLEKAGLHVTEHLEIGEPVTVIADMAEMLHAELVIVGHSRNKPLALRWWRGSVDALLVERLRCSLLIASLPADKAA